MTVFPSVKQTALTSELTLTRPCSRGPLSTLRVDRRFLSTSFSEPGGDFQTPGSFTVSPQRLLSFQARSVDAVSHPSRADLTRVTSRRLPHRSRFRVSLWRAPSQGLCYTDYTDPILNNSEQVTAYGQGRCKSGASLSHTDPPVTIEGDFQQQQQ